MKSKILKGTYKLKCVERERNQYMKCKQVIEGCLPTGEHKGRGRSSHGKEVSY
jgi:hypothetical protein